MIRVTDRLPESARDRDIVALAIAESRAIVTHDIDFTSLVALSGLDRPSVVSLRLTTVTLEATDRALQQALANHQSELLRGALVIVTDSKIRVRMLPLD